MKIVIIKGNVRYKLILTPTCEILKFYAYAAATVDLYR